MTEQGEVLSAKFSAAGDRPPRARADRQRGAGVDARAGHPTPRRLARCERGHGGDGAALRGGVPRRSSTATRACRRSSTPPRRSTRSPACSSARARRGARRRRTSPTSARSRGCSRWTQARIVLPAWYGLGSALEAAVRGARAGVAAEMEREWPFFSALLSNAEMACAKADLAVGRRYAELVEDRAVRSRIWGRIEAEFALTCRAAARGHRPGAAARARAAPARLDRPPQPAASTRSHCSRSSSCAAPGRPATATARSWRGRASSPSTASPRACATPAEPRSRSILAVALAPMAELVDAPG